MKGYTFTIRSKVLAECSQENLILFSCSMFHLSSNNTHKTFLFTVFSYRFFFIDVKKVCMYVHENKECTQLLRFVRKDFKWAWLNVVLKPLPYEWVTVTEFYDQINFPVISSKSTSSPLSSKILRIYCKWMTDTTQELESESNINLNCLHYTIYRKLCTLYVRKLEKMSLFVCNTCLGRKFEQVNNIWIYFVVHE